MAEYDKNNRGSKTDDEKQCRHKSFFHDFSPVHTSIARLFLFIEFFSILVV
jgi:hypothetical protein